jgi:hypothetical protein
MREEEENADRGLRIPDSIRNINFAATSGTGN